MRSCSVIVSIVILIIGGDCAPLDRNDILRLAKEAADRGYKVPQGQSVFVPPDVLYWASTKVNTTIYDNLGLPWYCYTTRQTHCLPLFPVPRNFKTTRRPFVIGGGGGKNDDDGKQQQHSHDEPEEAPKQDGDGGLFGSDFDSFIVIPGNLDNPDGDHGDDGVERYDIITDGDDLGDDANDVDVGEGSPRPDLVNVDNSGSEDDNAETNGNEEAGKNVEGTENLDGNVELGQAEGDDVRSNNLFDDEATTRPDIVLINNGGNNSREGVINGDNESQAETDVDSNEGTSQEEIESETRPDIVLVDNKDNKDRDAESQNEVLSDDRVPRKDGFSGGGGKNQASENDLVRGDASKDNANPIEINATSENDDQQGPVRVDDGNRFLIYPPGLYKVTTEPGLVDAGDGGDAEDDEFAGIGGEITFTTKYPGQDDDNLENGDVARQNPDYDDNDSPGQGTSVGGQEDGSGSFFPESRSGQTGIIIDISGGQDDVDENVGGGGGASFEEKGNSEADLGSSDQGNERSKSEGITGSSVSNTDEKDESNSDADVAQGADNGSNNYSNNDPQNVSDEKDAPDNNGKESDRNEEDPSEATTRGIENESQLGVGTLRPDLFFGAEQTDKIIGNLEEEATLSSNNEEFSTIVIDGFEIDVTATSNLDDLNEEGGLNIDDGGKDNERSVTDKDEQTIDRPQIDGDGNPQITFDGVDREATTTPTEVGEGTVRPDSGGGVDANPKILSNEGDSTNPRDGAAESTGDVLDEQEVVGGGGEVRPDLTSKTSEVGVKEDEIGASSDQEEDERKVVVTTESSTDAAGEVDAGTSSASDSGDATTPTARAAGASSTASGFRDETTSEETTASSPTEASEASGRVESDGNIFNIDFEHEDAQADETNNQSNGGDKESETRPDLQDAASDDIEISSIGASIETSDSSSDDNEAATANAETATSLPTATAITDADEISVGGATTTESGSLRPDLVDSDTTDRNDVSDNPNKVSKSPDNWIFDGEQWKQGNINITSSEDGAILVTTGAEDTSEGDSTSENEVKSDNGNDVSSASNSIEGATEVGLDVGVKSTSGDENLAEDNVENDGARRNITTVVVQTFIPADYEEDEEETASADDDAGTATDPVPIGGVVESRSHDGVEIGGREDELNLVTSSEGEGAQQSVDDSAADDAAEATAAATTTSIADDSEIAPENVDGTNLPVIGIASFDVVTTTTTDSPFDDVGSESSTDQPGLNVLDTVEAIVKDVLDRQDVKDNNTAEIDDVTDVETTTATNIIISAGENNADSSNAILSSNDQATSESPLEQISSTTQNSVDRPDIISLIGGTKTNSASTKSPIESVSSTTEETFTRPDIISLIGELLEDERELIEQLATRTTTESTTPKNSGTFFLVNERATTPRTNVDETAIQEEGSPRTLPGIDGRASENTVSDQEATSTTSPEDATGSSPSFIFKVLNDRARGPTTTRPSPPGDSSDETTTDATATEEISTLWPSIIIPGGTIEPTTEKEEEEEDHEDAATTTEDLSVLLSINSIFDQLKVDLMNELPKEGEDSTKDDLLASLGIIEEVTEIHNSEGGSQIRPDFADSDEGTEDYEGADEADKNSEDDNNVQESNVSGGSDDNDVEDPLILEQTDEEGDGNSRVTKQSNDEEACKSCHLAKEFESGDRELDPNVTTILLPGIGGYWDHGVGGNNITDDGEASAESSGTTSGSANGSDGSSESSGGATGAGGSSGGSETGPDGEVRPDINSSETTGEEVSSSGEATTLSPETSSDSQIDITVIPSITNIATDIATAINNSTESGVTEVVTTTTTATSTTTTPLILAQAYTVYGEPCKDACEKRDYKYTWCNKIEESDAGTWSYADYCTTESNVTPYGEPCLDECETRGYYYYWCHKTSSLWGYCTPESLVNLTKTWKFLTGGEEDLNTILSLGPGDSEKESSDSAVSENGSSGEANWVDITGSGGSSSNGEQNSSWVDITKSEVQVLAYTVYGEACYDTCELRDGLPYTWCHKVQESGEGTWPTRDHCTASSEITSDGKACIDDCHQTPGSSHFWCNTARNGVGFCTPRHLIDKLTNDDSDVDFDASLISPRGGVDLGVDKDDEGPFTFGKEMTVDEGDNSVLADIESETTTSLLDLDDIETLTATTYTETLTDTTTKPPPAVAFTAFGEACRDACARHDDQDYTWCHKIEPSDVGTWSDSDYCSADPGVTAHGEECVDECDTRGYDYYWCHKDSTLWGYCTPAHLIIK